MIDTSTKSDLMNTCCSTSFSSSSNYSSYELLSTSSALKLAENKEDLMEYLKEIGLLASEVNDVNVTQRCTLQLRNHLAMHIASCVDSAKENYPSELVQFLVAASLRLKKSF